MRTREQLTEAIQTTAERLQQAVRNLQAVVDAQIHALYTQIDDTEFADDPIDAGAHVAGD